MKNLNAEKEKLAQQYDRFAERFNHIYAAGKERGQEAIVSALEKAREQLTELGEFSEEQGRSLEKFLMRDLEQTLIDLEQLGKEAQEVLHPARLGAGALASLASVLKLTGNALQSLSNKVTDGLTYRTGEMTAAGSLTCQGCGQKVQLKQTGHVPPCPKCNGTLFHKGY